MVIFYFTFSLPSTQIILRNVQRKKIKYCKDEIKSTLFLSCRFSSSTSGPSRLQPDRGRHPERGGVPGVELVPKLSKLENFSIGGSNPDRPLDISAAPSGPGLRLLHAGPALLLPRLLCGPSSPSSTTPFYGGNFED